MLSWANTQLHSSLGYRLVYPNFMEQCQLGEESTESLVEKGTIEVTKQLEIIENEFLSKTKYIIGRFNTLFSYLRLNDQRLTFSLLLDQELS